MAGIVKEDFNEVLIEQAKLMSEASFLLESVLSNIFGFLDDLSSPSSYDIAKQREDNFRIIQEAKDAMQNVTVHLEKAHREIPALADALKESDQALKESEQKLMNCQALCNSMQEELEKPERLLRESEIKYKDLEKEFSVQANYTAAMGSIMGSMLWHSSKNEGVINKFLEESLLKEFLVMSTVTLRSFLKSYEFHIPAYDSYEFKFVMSVLGVNVNISAYQSGLDFVVNDLKGILFIEKVLEFLGRIPSSAGDLMKLLCLQILYNIGSTKKGAKLIQDNREGVKNILACLGPDYSDKIQSTAWNIMPSLFHANPNPRFCEQVKDLTSREIFQQLMEQLDEKVRDFCMGSPCHSMSLF